MAYRDPLKLSKDQKRFVRAIQRNVADAPARMTATLKRGDCEYALALLTNVAFHEGRASSYVGDLRTPVEPIRNISDRVQRSYMRSACFVKRRRSR